MNIRDEELLQQYFDNRMPNGEEQNFLIDVAARDEMRLAFRSQLELVKAVRKDKDAMPGTTFVRERTLGALGLSAALAGATSDAEAMPLNFWQKTKAFVSTPLTSLAVGLIIGGAGVYSFTNTSSPTVDNVLAPTIQTISPAQQSPTRTVPDAITGTVPQPVDATQKTVGETETKRSAVRPAAVTTTNKNVTTDVQKTKIEQKDLPVITTQNPATVKSNPPMVTTPQEGK